MPRGFDQLNTPVGYFFLAAATMLLCAAIIFGGMAWRVLMRRDSEVRAKLRSDLARDQKATPASKPSLLDRLHDEVLMCIVDGKPLPNPVVYTTPWYRDAAMMAMVLRETGEIHRIRDWILGLASPYDRCNAGIEEPDNLGQALFLISLVADSNHPLVPTILEEAKRRAPEGWLTGQTDFAEHPIYATRWLKLGLRSLGLDDPYQLPVVTDSYEHLFWMDGGVMHRTPNYQAEADYPYLAWAEAHALGLPAPVSLLGGGTEAPAALPEGVLTWERNASQADYSAYQSSHPALAHGRLCGPHSWHAAEAFLLLHLREGERA